MKPGSANIGRVSDRTKSTETIDFSLLGPRCEIATRWRIERNDRHRSTQPGFGSTLDHRNLSGSAVSHRNRRISAFSKSWKCFQKNRGMNTNSGMRVP